ncbi:MAG: glycosyltransferase family 4 protein [Chitinophagaceae bacterium]
MPSKQRIAFVANTSWSIYKFRLYLLQTLIEKGFDVYVLAPRDKYTAHFEYIEGISFVELKKLRSKSISLLDDLQLYRELLHHYKQLRPHLIFHYTIKANIYGSIAASRINCSAVSVITGLGYMFTGKSIFKFAASRLYGYALKKTKEVWFLNRDDQQIFINDKLVAAEKTFLLPGEGVDTNKFYPAPYQETKNPVSFLLIARIIEHKGIYEFVQAAEMLLAKNIHAKFSLLGFFDDKSAVAISKEQLTVWEKNGSVSYLGETDYVIPYIEKNDCIVLPSYREGMPLSLLEGGSMCKALIASDVAGCREIVKDGINGFLCEQKDAVSLAAKMEQYYNLPAAAKKAMGIAARETVMQYFTNEIISNIYLSKLDSLIV